MNYLQMNSRSKFDKEEKSLAECFGEGNYVPFYKKNFLRGKIQLTKNDFISGDIDVMLAAMKQLGIEYEYTDYPEELKEFLCRKVWISTMKELRNELYDKGSINPVFVKPCGKLKRFTGHVIETIDDLAFCNNAGNQTKIWCSEPVDFVFECRCPVIEGHVEGYFPAPGFENPEEWIKEKLDEKFELEVQKMAHCFQKAPKAYVLDVGILRTGEIALIEVNDAFSLGQYGMPNDLYAKLLTTRWNELKSSII